MPYAMYIDESGEFNESELNGAARISLVAGWIASNDNDHADLRAELGRMRKEVSLEANQTFYHATDWRKTAVGRRLLMQVFQLVANQAPYAVMAIENRRPSLSQNADSTYLDMLVELIVGALFNILENRKAKEAFPLQVYVAERKGVPDWEITKLAQYRLRALLAGSAHKETVGNTTIFQAHVRSLHLGADLLDSPQSRTRGKYALMPELILADFLCNSMFQLKKLEDRPEFSNSIQWEVFQFNRDSFWRDLQVFKKQGRWVELVVDMTNPAAKTWYDENPKQQQDFSELLADAFKRCAGSLLQVQKLFIETDRLIRDTRDWAHAISLIEFMGSRLHDIAGHLKALVEWHLGQYRLVVANHTGDHPAAKLAYEKLRSRFAYNDYQRVEFLTSVADLYNRHAVSVTDTYDFDDAEKILTEAIAIEKKMLAMQFEIQGIAFTLQYSDTLGRLLSTLGQLRTKQAKRDPSKAVIALNLFEEAEKHLQQSYDAARQENYRIEAYLATQDSRYADKVYKALAGQKNITADKFLKRVGPHSFDMIFWLRWMLIPGNKAAAPYIQVLLENHQPAFLQLEGGCYPQMSNLYYFGQIAWQQSEAKIAAIAWNAAAQVGRKFSYAGVLQTLALRPLCELALHVPAESEAAIKSVRNILEAIRAGKTIHPGYFQKYFKMLSDGTIEDGMLQELRDDIPYS